MYTYSVRFLAIPYEGEKYAVVRFRDGDLRPWYLKNVRNGQYIWYHDLINAKPYRYSTAMHHLKALRKGV